MLDKIDSMYDAVIDIQLCARAGRLFNVASKMQDMRASALDLLLQQVWRGPVAPACCTAVPLFTMRALLLGKVAALCIASEY